MSRQRPEHQAAVDPVIFVNLPDDVEKLLFGSVRVQDERSHAHAELLGALDRRALVRQIVGPLAHPHDRERRDNAPVPQRLDARDSRLAHSIDDFFAEQQLRHSSPFVFATNRVTC